MALGMKKNRTADPMDRCNLSVPIVVPDPNRSTYMIEHMGCCHAGALAPFAFSNWRPIWKPSHWFSIDSNELSPKHVNEIEKNA